MVKTLVISLDFETTGLSVYTDEITQFGVHVSILEDGLYSHVGEFNEYVMCQCEISTKSAEITGITKDVLVQKDAQSFPVVFRKYVSYVDEICPDDVVQRVLVGYNLVSFDLPILFSELMRHEQSLLPHTPSRWCQQLKITNVVDLLKYAREHVDGTLLKRRVDGRCSYKLGDVYSSLFAHKFSDAHDALADARAVTKLCEHGAFEDMCLCEVHDVDGEWCQNIMHLFQCMVIKIKTRRGDAKKVRETKVQTLVDMFARARKRKRSLDDDGRLDSVGDVTRQDKPVVVHADINSVHGR
jgi:DNA polymerase III epsilon subunit-like protein